MPVRSTSLPRPKSLLLIALPLVLVSALALRACVVERRSGEALPVADAQPVEAASAESSSAIEPAPVAEADARSEENVSRPASTAAAATSVRVVPPMMKASTTFVVRDSTTSALLTRFGLRVQLDDLSPYSAQQSYGGKLEVRDHPTGSVERIASEGHHHVRCEAPGFAPFAAVVRHDAPDGGVQTISLERGSRIVGRATRERIRGVVLTLQPFFDARGLPRSPDDIEWEWLWGYRYDVSLHFGVSRDVVVDDRGAFAIEDLADGTYRLLITRTDKSLVMLEEIGVADAVTKDLGFIDLDATGSIVGRVRIDRVARTQVVLELDQQARQHAGQPPIEIAPDADGRFAVADVPVGTHRLGATVRAVSHSPVRPLLVTVSAGETSRVDWNLEQLLSRPTCVRVERNGMPAGAVRLVAARWEHHDDLGVTDEAGRACGQLQPAYENVLATSGTGVPLGLLDFAGRLAPPDHEEHELRLTCGRVLLRLDENLRYDESCGFRLHLQRDDGPIRRCDVSVPRPSSGPARDGEPVFDPVARTLLLPQLAAGRWNLTALVSPPEALGYVALAEVEVADGLETVCELRFN